MLEIDGSMGEGGGSVLRLSLALASIKSEPIRVYNIRANRSKPGLANQHLHAVKSLKELTEAKTKGLEIGSEEVVFEPKRNTGKDIKVDIGTAGSTTLILQSVMIPAAFAEEPVSIEVKGGTDNPFAPPIDYLKNVTIPILEKLGYHAEINLVKRGHYPKGGGIIKAEINPIEKLKPLNLTEAGKVSKISGVSHCVKLPSHIAKRQAEAAKERLAEAGHEAGIEVEYYEKSEDPHLSPGTGVVLWAETRNGSILGSNGHGEKGKPAEKVGKEAAEKLLDELETGKALDKYLTDQIIPYLSLAEGQSIISTTELTSHTLTNVELVEKILGTEIEVSGMEGEPGEISVRGKALQN